MGKRLRQRLRALHVVVRILVFAFLLWEARSFTTLPPRFTLILVGGYAVLDLILSMGFLGIALESTTLLVLDLAAGTCFLALFKGWIVFALPFFLATYAAANVSWEMALGTSFLGTLLFAGANVFVFHDVRAIVLVRPNWLLLLTINLLVSTVGLLRTESQKQSKKMDSLINLLEVGQQLGSTLTYDHVYKITFEVAKNLFNATTCVIYFNDADATLRIQAIESQYSKLFSNFNPKAVKTVVAKIMQGKKTEVFSDLRLLSETEEQALPKARFIRGGMIAPLLLEEKILGIIVLAADSPGVYNEDSMKLFATLANQITMAIWNVQLHEKTTTMAITDSVSNLYTHGYMQEVLEKEFRRCKYANLPLSTIILDVDYFKVVNDTYGHPEGDALLRQLAAVIKTMTRATDIVCRYGGDEFMIILPETNRIGAVLVAERVRQTVEEHQFVLGSHIVRITISGGVASFPEGTGTKKELVDKTDQALYKSKQEGRNRVSFSA